MLVNPSKLLLIFYKLRAINNILFQLLNQLDEVSVDKRDFCPLDAVDIFGFFPPIARYLWIQFKVYGSTLIVLK